jgi:hypothetical protein
MERKLAAEEDKVKDGRWRGNLPLKKIRQREEGCQGERKRDIESAAEWIGNAKHPSPRRSGLESKIWNERQTSPRNERSE